MRLAHLLPVLGVLPVTLALLGFSAHDSGAFERVPCAREVQYHIEHAKITDRFNKGYLEVGFEFSVTIQEAAATLNRIGAHWAIKHPYQHFAWVCTRPGEEEEWENLLQGVDGVQYVHQQGVNPLAIED